MISATRRRLEALCRAFRMGDQEGIMALRRKLNNTCAGAWEMSCKQQNYKKRANRLCGLPKLKITGMETKG